MNARRPRADIRTNTDRLGRSPEWVPSARARTTRTPGTHQREARRPELLDAVAEVFGKRGYLDTRVADVVAAAGVSHGTFETMNCVWAAAVGLPVENDGPPPLTDLHSNEPGEQP